MMNFSLKYLNLLKTKFEGLNLTRILDEQQFYDKQILDSVLPYEQCEDFKLLVDNRKLVVDVGFGGGFPILPLAFHLPKIRFIGFESKMKKVEAVNVIATDLGLPNAKTYHYRIEDVLIDRPCVVTFKAVGTVTDFLKKINVSKKDVSIFFYKGPSFAEKEQSEFEATLAKGWELFVNFQLKVPGTDERRIIGFRPRNVPRGTSKNLVKLSDIF